MSVGEQNTSIPLNFSNIETNLNTTCDDKSAILEFKTPRESAICLIVNAQSPNTATTSETIKIPRRMSSPSLKILSSITNGKLDIENLGNSEYKSAGKSADTDMLPILQVLLPGQKGTSKIIRRSQSLNVPPGKTFKSPRTSIGMVDHHSPASSHKFPSYESLVARTEVENHCPVIEFPISESQSAKLPAQEDTLPATYIAVPHVVLPIADESSGPATSRSVASNATVVISPSSERSSQSNLGPQSWTAREPDISVSTTSSNNCSSNSKRKSFSNTVYKKQPLPIINFPAFRGQDAFPQSEKQKIDNLLASSASEDVIADPAVFPFYQSHILTSTTAHNSRVNRLSRFLSSKISKNTPTAASARPNDGKGSFRITNNAASLQQAHFVNFSMPQKVAESRKGKSNSSSDSGSKSPRKLGVKFRKSNKKKKIVNRATLNLLKLYIHDRQVNLATKLVESLPPKYFSQESRHDAERAFLNAMLSGLESLCLQLYGQGVLENINEPIQINAQPALQTRLVENKAVKFDSAPTLGNHAKSNIQLPSWLLFAISLGLNELARAMINTQQPDATYAWYGITYLGLAAARGSTDIILRLLSKGLNPLYPSLTFARVRRFQELKAPLIQHLHKSFSSFSPMSSERCKAYKAAIHNLENQATGTLIPGPAAAQFTFGQHTTSLSGASSGPVESAVLFSKSEEITAEEKLRRSHISEKIHNAHPVANASLPVLCDADIGRDSSVESNTVSSATPQQPNIESAITNSCPSKLEGLDQSREASGSQVLSSDCAKPLGDGGNSQIFKDFGKYLIFPLDLAIANGHIETAQAILGKGASNLASFSNFALLHNALYFHDPPSALFFQLLATGCNPNQRNCVGQTPLHVAARAGNLDACLALLLFKANINATDCCGWTPLHEAVSVRNWVIASFLVSKGSDLTIKNTDGYTALLLAQQQNVSDILLDRIFANGSTALAADVLTERETKLQHLLRQAIASMSLKFVHQQVLVEPALSVHSNMSHLNALPLPNSTASTSGFANNRLSVLSSHKRLSANSTVSQDSSAGIQTSVSYKAGLNLTPPSLDAKKKHGSRLSALGLRTALSPTIAVKKENEEPEQPVASGESSNPPSKPLLEVVAEDGNQSSENNSNVETSGAISADGHKRSKSILSKLAVFKKKKIRSDPEQHKTDKNHSIFSKLFK